MDLFEKQILRYGLTQLDCCFEEILEYEIELTKNGTDFQLFLKQDDQIILELDQDIDSWQDYHDYFTTGVLTGANIKQKLALLGQLDSSLKAVRYQEDPGEIKYYYFQDENVQSQLEWTLTLEKVDLAGNFVLSGEFVELSRATLADIILKKQGRVMGSVSQKTDYLVIGTNNSKNWKFESYGTKIQTALKINQDKEKKICFIQEKHLVKWLEKCGLT